MSAVEILTKAAGHMQDRASTYDKPEGERSMAQTVAIFNLYHGLGLTEAQGWHLLQILKDVRLFTRPGYHADSAEDCVAYAALKAEALKHADVVAAALGQIDPVVVANAAAFNADWPNELRRQDAQAEDEAFAAIEASQPRIDSGPMWVEWRGSDECPCNLDMAVEVRFRNGRVVTAKAGELIWTQDGSACDIVAWRDPWPEDQAYTGQGGVMIQCPGCVATSCECRP